MQMHNGQDKMSGILEGQGKIFKTELELIRLRFEQSGDKGSAAEKVLREFLRLYLPRDKHIGHGEVFNIDGDQSRQTDLVVANEYHVNFERDDEISQSFIIENVDFAGEVKMGIYKYGDLQDCFQRARDFKSIFAYDGGGKYVLERPDDWWDCFLNRRPYLAFAFGSELSNETIIKYLNEWESEVPHCEQPTLDAFYVLDKIALINPWDPNDRDRNTGNGPWLQVASGSDVLSRMLLDIYRLPQAPKIPHHPLLPYLMPNDGLRFKLLADRRVVRVDPKCADEIVDFERSNTEIPDQPSS